MGTRISFKPLCGVHGSDPLCYLLQVDEFTFLLDCGWSDRMDEAALQPLRDMIPQIDAVLLSHSDTAHLGALPYAVGRLGLSAPTYATLPTVKMGLMVMYDQYLSHSAVSDFQMFSLDDVDAALDAKRVHTVKFQQTVKLKGESHMQCRMQKFMT